MAKTPVNRETVKKLLDALTPMNPEVAEKFVQDVLRLADERRRELERVVGDVAKAGVRTAEGIATSVQHELGRQVTKMAGRIDDLERQVDNLNRALDSTRESLLALAAKSLGQDSHTTDGDSKDSSNSEKAKKTSKDKKKSDKKSKQVKRRSKTDEVGEHTTTDTPAQADTTVAVTGI